LTSTAQRLGEVGERALLQRIRARIPAGEGVVVGIGDDTAAVQTGPVSLVTADSLVEGVHFRRDCAPARLVGRKALSVNLSDVAAMGGAGRYAIVSLCLPPDVEIAWVDALFDGLLARAAETGVSLVGGNLARTADAIVVDVTLLGEGTRPMLRSAAQPGDVIVVTGALGAAAEGVALLEQGARLDEDGELVATGIWTESSAEALAACLRAQLDPSPPLSLARAIAESELARAAMDLSDGLSSDLAEMCRMSGVGARVEATAVPVAPAVCGLERARGGDALARALHGGEDYELLLAVDPFRLEELRELSAVWGAPVTGIGEFLAGEPEVRLRDGAGERVLEPRGHDHFPPPPDGGGA
jgi:thiamine-monophosphate kinase